MSKKKEDFVKANVDIKQQSHLEMKKIATNERRFISAVYQDAVDLYLSKKNK